MPCRDYWSDGIVSSRSDATEKRLKAQCDKLARIACKAMDALVKDGREDFLLLKDDEVREWWQKHQEEDRRAREEAEAKQRRKEAKEQALAKLSDEEKILLGLKKR
jgi:uncharacterized protein YdaU (DUF1376 family)